MGYDIKIYRRKSRWPDREKVTPLSKEYEKTIVDFIDDLDPGRIFWSWMPRNDDVVKIVEALLKEPHSEEFKEKLMGVLS